jgi:hypothetical protein
MSAHDLSGVEPLPYRRVLTDEESNSIRDLLRAQWQIDDDFWYPLDRAEDDEPPPNTNAFYVPGFPTTTLVALVVSVTSPERIFELTEGALAPDREIDVGLFDEPYYGRGGLFAGGECMWTNRSGDWVVYVSHEASITVAGEALLRPLVEQWPDWRTWVYQGWEPEHYPSLPDDE